jgi:cephalosporin hydroxylase
MKLNYNVDFQCKTKSTDVTVSELMLMTECMAERDIKNYLEVGVWHGATLYSVVNLFKLNDVELDAYGYDCFDEGAPVDVENSHTSGWPSKKEVEDTLRSAGKVTLITGDSANVHNVITDKKFDFVFHDANHTRDAIITDLIALKNILNPNAYVAVHNSAWDEPYRKFFGKTAIDYLAANKYYKVLGTADTATLLQSI